MNGLPLRHRAALAGVLFLVALVAGTWSSTLVDREPTLWGVLLGSIAGAAASVVVLVGRRHRRPTTMLLL
jgi:hypothetical protein